jgi:glutathione reductase (NADPH)
MSDYDYDLFVIGGGSGGVRAARMSATMGGRVALCEELYYGGTCVNVGCVPKKLFAYGAHFAEDFEDATAYGWEAQRPRFDWQTLRANKDKEIARLGAIYKGMLERAGVDVIDGRGVLTDAHTVEVAGKRYTAANILIAVGGAPHVPNVVGKDHALTSNDLFALDELPASICIVGGGYIAVEFAGILHGFGVEVSIAHRGKKLLRGFDEDVRDVIAREMQKKGIELHLGAAMQHMERMPSGKMCVECRDGEVLSADEVLVATGRFPNTEGLGLEELGVRLDERGGVIVDEEYRTNLPHIFAVGDVIHRVQLTPVALAEGMAVAHRLFGDKERPVNYENIPTAVFSEPNVGTVGMTELAARAHYDEVVIFKSQFTPLKHTLTGRGEKTFMKLVVDKASDRVLGCHMVGPDAGEIVQGLAVALNCGATKAQFDSTIGVHPSAAEEFVTMRTPSS